MKVTESEAVFLALSGSAVRVRAIRIEAVITSHEKTQLRFHEGGDDRRRREGCVGVELAQAPALPVSLNLYNQLEWLGFKIFLLTRRSKYQRNATAKNLIFAGYNHWERLLLRGLSDQGTLATDFKSHKRSDLINEGYRIHGSLGDQWSHSHQHQPQPH
ncbi:hypothetical protein ACFX2F_043538 [Malus domestica]